MNRSKIETAAIFISALSTFALASFAGYGLFLTSIPQAIIDSLNQEVSVLRAEKRQLISLRNEYIAITQSEIIGPIIWNLERKYKLDLITCEQAIHLQGLQKWIKAGVYKWVKNPKDGKWIDPYATAPKAFRDELNGIFPIKMFCMDCTPRKELPPAEFYKERKKSFTKPNHAPTGIEIINYYKKIKLIDQLPKSDKNKLHKFLDDYVAQKISIYKAKTRPNLARGWTVSQLKKHAEQVKKDVEKMQKDLPALKFALQRFFEQELIIPQ